MASNLGKFELTFIFLRVRCHHYEFFAKTRSKQDHGCELFPAKVQMVAFVRVCLMCEPASHAVHASQGASHASHRFNAKNNQIMDIIM